MMKLTPCQALCAGLFSLVCTEAAATTYTYTLLEATGALQTNAIAINASGTVLGYWVDSNYTAHGFTYANAKFTSFDVPNATGTRPNGINAKGEIVGTYQDANYNQHGFILSPKGKYTYVDLPGSGFTGLNAINDKGIAVGAGADSSGNSEIFTYDHGVFTPIVDNGQSPVAVGINIKGSVAGYYQPPHAYETSFLYAKGSVVTIPIKGVYFAQSFGINNRNFVVGQVANNQRQQFGFIYNGNTGKVKLIGPPGSTNSFNTGINNSNVVVGLSVDSNSNYTGFVYDRGTYNTLSIAGESDVGATGINDSGLVVGDYYDTASSVAGTFLATPQN